MHLNLSLGCTKIPIIHDVTSVIYISYTYTFQKYKSLKGIMGKILLNV